MLGRLGVEGMVGSREVVALLSLLSLFDVDGKGFITPEDMEEFDKKKRRRREEVNMGMSPFRHPPPHPFLSQRRREEGERLAPYPLHPSPSSRPPSSLPLPPPQEEMGFSGGL